MTNILHKMLMKVNTVEFLLISKYSLYLKKKSLKV